MTITSNDRRRAYVATGSSDTFNGPMAYLASQLVVTRRRAGVESGVAPSEYVVSRLARANGTSIKFNVMPLAGDEILIRRVVPYDQLTDVTNQGAFHADVIERGFDERVFQIQQLADAIGRALTIRDDYPLALPNMQLPDPEANKAIGWNSTKTALQNIDLSGPADLLLRTDLATPASGASIVAFRQAGTGARGRTVEAKLRDVISVKDFGAIGDGNQHPLSERYATLAAAQVDYPHALALTDQIDWAASQAAINYVANIVTGGARGGWLEFPAGRYVTNRELVVDVGKPVNIRGCGEGTQFRATGSINVFRLKTNMIIRDLMFVGAFSGVSTGIYMDAANVARVEACIFQNQATGIVLNNTFAAEVASCVFDVCNNYGIYAGTGAHNSVIEKNNFFSVGVSGNGQAIAFDVNSDNLVINGNDFEYCNVNILLRDCRSVEVCGNYMEYQKAANILFGGTCTGIIIESNWIALGDAVGGGATWLVENITGGRFMHNVIFNQTINFSNTTLNGFTVGVNNKLGTGTLGLQPWRAPTLLNSWVAQSGYSTPGFMKDERGWVHLRGAMTGGTAPSDVFTLPAGYRPATACLFSTASANGAVRVYVNNAGTVRFEAAASNNGALDGISFYAAN